MKKTILPIITVGVLTLTGCSTDSSTEETQSSLVTGVVGKQHGMDCADSGECSVHFTVDQLRIIDSCTDTFTGDIVEGPLIDLHATVTTAGSQVTPDFDSALWTSMTDWSILDSEGNDVPIEIEPRCLPEEGWRGTWDESTFPGDTRKTEQRYRIPADARTLRLTDSLNESRWEFDLATVATTQAGHTPNPTPPAPEPAFTPAPAPAAPSPVIGFTGAPGVDFPRVLDKTIASCGDPMIHETGTTFFTDGTSGWTEECANQMGYLP